MPQQATATSPRHRGWFFDQVNGRLAALYNGTEVFDFDANDMIVTAAATHSADLIISDGAGAVIGNSTQLTVNALIPELQVQGDTVGVDGAALIALYSSTAGNGPELILARSKSATLGTNTIVANNDSLGRILFVGADGSTGFDPAAAIQAEVAGTPGAATDMPGRLLFQTSPDGSQTPATRMTVLSGATTVAQAQLGTAGTSTGSLLLAGATSGVVTFGAQAVAGTWTMQLPAANGACGTQLTENGAGVTTWAAASLGAWKHDLGVVDPCNALSRVKSAPVHRFTYDRSKVPSQYWAPEYEMTGVFAEEAPWAMQGTERTFFSPLNAFGTLAAAVQALAAKVEALEARN
jgi:hypothetical protein